jgi:hypothetical protein
MSRGPFSIKLRIEFGNCRANTVVLLLSRFQLFYRILARGNALICPTLLLEQHSISSPAAGAASGNPVEDLRAGKIWPYCLN